MIIFSDQLLGALGAWQNGWREMQSRRESLASALCEHVESLPSEFRTVSAPCYRKRFIHKGEMVDLFLSDSRDEGVASWTLDLRLAERLKGLTRDGAVSAAIFKHTPSESEVIVSFPALWASQHFQHAVTAYASRNGHHASALLNFKDTQQEVVLRAPLRGTEMIALTGASSPFDDICDRIGIKDDQRDGIFKTLVDNGIYPGEVQFIDKEATQRVVTRSIQRLYMVVKEHLERQQSSDTI
ncbi:hypothetical protein JR065_18870 [Xanthomonas sp. AmX2]|uniref:hypothetical protein n=1 Tax=Xanthomonas sp. TaxID=29446 RepID=UPI00197EF1F3|nr:hypothetical protein [Xanthomonas sp.]MBN6152405.1 hypothetical protein [Xanthomonas sp.]